MIFCYTVHGGEYMKEFSKPLKRVDLLFATDSMYGEMDPKIENMKFDF